MSTQTARHVAARLRAAYGTRRDYPKIDLFYDGRYVATTSWARTMREAKEKFLESRPRLDPSRLRASKQAR